jgi:hypothetical protein
MRHAARREKEPALAETVIEGILSPQGRHDEDEADLGQRAAGQESLVVVLFQRQQGTGDEGEKGRGSTEAKRSRGARPVVTTTAERRAETGAAAPP